MVGHVRLDRCCVFGLVLGVVIVWGGGEVGQRREGASEESQCFESPLPPSHTTTHIALNAIMPLDGHVVLERFMFPQRGGLLGSVGAVGLSANVPLDINVVHVGLVALHRAFLLAGERALQHHDPVEVAHRGLEVGHRPTHFVDLGPRHPVLAGVMWHWHLASQPRNVCAGT